MPARALSYLALSRSSLSLQTPEMFVGMHSLIGARDCGPEHVGCLFQLAGGWLAKPISKEVFETAPGARLVVVNMPRHGCGEDLNKQIEEMPRRTVIGLHTGG